MTRWGKRIVWGLMLAFAVTPAYAKKKGKKKKKRAKKTFSRPYGMAGCGLGSVILGKQGGQLSASTTNATSGNQTFGITSGTSNCVDGKKGRRAAEIDFFLKVNKPLIAAQMARGSGEHLEAMAGILGCPQTSSFSSALKEHYNNIKPARKDIMAVTDAVITVVINDEILGQTCFSERIHSS